MTEILLALLPGDAFAWRSDDHQSRAPDVESGRRGVIFPDGIGTSRWDRDGGTANHSPLGDFPRVNGGGYSGSMKVAAYQAPVLTVGSMEALDLIQDRIQWCESEGVSILCCPEAILGGLADFSENPARFAIKTTSGEGEVASLLATLASETVTSIVGFTELAGDRLYNSVAVFERGRVIGLYRKLHPALRRSIYSAGSSTPVFRVAGLMFGVVICYDSTFREPAAAMAAQGARLLFVPTNNALLAARANVGLVKEARATDIARAVENHVWVIRADVAGAHGGLVSYGSSGIVDPNGRVVQEANLNAPDLLIAELAD